ncbi:GTP-binding protein [Flavobacterium lutivivi]|jgi:hypothetical protein|nr:GTP-binding protein [Flavobacterium lutivivi]HRG18658.1 DUF465 domain-containing protein [Flavobacterium lutivivi]
MEKHNLINEFPEFREKIHDLKMQNAHFKKLFEEYEVLENEIYKINTEQINVSDEHAHDLKAKMLHLKDELFSLIKE